MHEEDRKQIVKQFPLWVEQKSGWTGLIIRWRHKDGSCRYCESNGVAILDSLGCLTGFRGVDRDITEHKLAEEEREKLLKTLAEKNEELESIVYVGSHDLRSPLVNIEGFSGELDKMLETLRVELEQSGFTEHLSEQTRSYLIKEIPTSLKYIHNGTLKMDRLLAGLLRLSRIGQAPLQIIDVDVNNVISRVAANLKFKMDKAGVKFEVDQLPHCLADDAQLEQVFSNVIDNAIKYRDKNRPCLIHISGQVQHDMIIYCIEDSGIGIDVAYKEKVFEIFHQLNPNAEIEGQGLGLTIVRRIVARHKGRVWLESELGKGTKLLVAIPRTG
jgi:light-regulated signal transduction histidine kinase (bacteriophytochrome)